MDDFKHDKEMLSKKYEQPFNGFVLLNDGGCSYEEKARNVQRMGAQALIVLYDPEMYIEHRLNHVIDNRYDGTGNLVHIPTLIMHADDGETLFGLYRMNKTS